MANPTIIRPRLPLVPIGSKVVPFCGSYLESYKGNTKKELLRSLWVPSDPCSQSAAASAGHRGASRAPHLSKVTPDPSSRKPYTLNLHATKPYYPNTLQHPKSRLKGIPLSYSTKKRGPNSGSLIIRKARLWGVR